jgi:hypothetical protein
MQVVPNLWEQLGEQADLVQTHAASSSTGELSSKPTVAHRVGGTTVTEQGALNTDL